MTDHDAPSGSAHHQKSLSQALASNPEYLELEQQLYHELERAGITFDDYLAYAQRERVEQLQTMINEARRNIILAEAAETPEKAEIYRSSIKQHFKPDIAAFRRFLAEAAQIQGSRDQQLS